MTSCRTCGSVMHNHIDCPSAVLLPEPQCKCLWWVIAAELLSFLIGLAAIFAMFMLSGCVVVNYPQSTTSTNRVSQRMSAPVPPMPIRVHGTNSTRLYCSNVSLHQVPVLGSNSWESARQYVVTFQVLGTNTWGATVDGCLKLVTTQDWFVQGKIYSIGDGL